MTELASYSYGHCWRWGTVAVHGGHPTAIVAPWHPLRMVAMVRKARRVAYLVHRLRTTPQVDFGDPRFFFHELHDELTHPHYPEVGLGWQGDQPELLALTDTAGDYTLHELPIVSMQAPTTQNENPAEGANRVAELVRRYLVYTLTNKRISVVLYNCDSSPSITRGLSTSWVLSTKMRRTFAAMWYCGTATPSN